jgi:hypothetical protein
MNKNKSSLKKPKSRRFTNSFNNNKRGQMEIMGLVVVVILIIIGVLFAIRFVVLKEPTDIKQSYRRSQLASNLGVAILKTSAEECRGTSVKELIIDWANRPESFGSIVCSDQDFSRSGVYVNKTIGNLLNRSINNWNTRYAILGYTDINNPLFTFNNLDCTNNMPGDSESFFLPTKRGVLTFNIHICS